ncbi:N-acetyltransferase [Leptotrichia sp. OH3620_COT-345]|uniref:GNAT family N-acetyltransferase n=1 Tax=Leptotrichia sp. OH3620_COT-345 TaxID=2491048 RepID=UPI000F652BD7|nr:GNAT family N-acetyltransferase [Leptotrichia sp. OH3620_COT-345]RRD40275.1 N-acetyltransferase [Leptotrichia sp. OH3620_COT-345]
MDIKHLEDKGFFIYDDKGEMIAELTYKKDGNKLIFDHTYVSPSLRGQGVGDKLFAAGIEFAENNNYKVVPVCSYIVKKFESGKYDYIKA